MIALAVISVWLVGIALVMWLEDRSHKNADKDHAIADLFRRAFSDRN